MMQTQIDPKNGKVVEEREPAQQEQPTDPEEQKQKQKLWQ